jgi:hypothetical protein
MDVFERTASKATYPVFRIVTPGSSKPPSNEACGDRRGDEVL